MTEQLKQARAVLDEAAKTIDGPRQADYGHPRINFANIAACWSMLFGVKVSPRQVAIAMVMLKACREIGGGKSHDTLVDIAGYAALAEEVDAERPTPRTAPMLPTRHFTEEDMKDRSQFYHGVETLDGHLVADGGKTVLLGERIVKANMPECVHLGIIWMRRLQDCTVEFGFCDANGSHDYALNNYYFIGSEAKHD